MVNIRIYGYSDTCWWYFLWECVLKILGHIVWSLQTGTWHWRAFVVPISDLIHQRILQIFCLFVCLFGWINPGQSNPWDASTRGARSSPKTVLLSARKPPGEYSKKEPPPPGGFSVFRDKRRHFSLKLFRLESKSFFGFIHRVHTPVSVRNRQDRYFARNSGGVSRKRRRNGEE